MNNSITNIQIKDQRRNSPFDDCNALLLTDPLSPNFPWELKSLFERIRFSPEIIIPIANRVFAAIKSVNFPKKDKNYSLLLDTFLMVKGRLSQPWRNFTDFMDWWGFDNFREEDYQPISLRTGNMMKSLAERAYSRYYKALKSKLGHEECDISLIDNFIHRLQELHYYYPEFKYAIYHLAQLQLLLGRKEEALETILPLARTRQREFWIWDILGQTAPDPETALSCYCRGLLCRVDAHFLVKLRVKAAQLMHQLGYDGFARAEIRQWYKVYDRNGWNLPPEVVKMVKSDWYQAAEVPMSNYEFYKANLAKSEQFLFSGIKEQPILITGVNLQKGLVNYLTADRRQGFFFNKGMRTPCYNGNVFLVRLEESNVPGHAAKLLSYKKENDINQYIGTFFRHFSGELKIFQNRSYGFADDVFINGNLISLTMEPGSQCSGLASISYNFKKQDFNWVAIYLED